MVSLIDILRSARRDIYKHQLDFVSDLMWLPRPRALLADDVGLGKTIQAVLFIKVMLELRNARAVLIIVPRAVLRQWSDELSRFGVIHYVIESPDFVYGHRVYLITLDRAKAEPYISKLLGVEWDLVVVDEAHKIRLGTLRQQISHICRNSLGCLLLSATPHTGDDKDFKFLIGLVDNVMIRREKKDVELYEGRRIFPRLRYWIVNVRSSEREAEALRRILELTNSLGIERIVRVVLEKRAMSSPISFLKTLSKLTGGECNDEMLEEGELDGCIAAVGGLKELRELAERFLGEYDAKLGALKRLLDVLGNGRKVLVFTEYATTAEYLFKSLSEGCRLIASGEGFGKADCGDLGVMYATAKARERIDVEVEASSLANSFKSALFISTDILSEGVNLQQYDVLVNYEVVWSPTKHIQRVGRIWRFGQRAEEVLVVDMVLNVGPNRGEYSMYADFLEKLYQISLHTLPPQSYGEFEIYQIEEGDVNKLLEINSASYFTELDVYERVRAGKVEEIRRIIQKILNEREKMKWKPKELVYEGLKVKVGFPPSGSIVEAGGGYYVVETTCRCHDVEVYREKFLVRLDTSLSKVRQVREALFRESEVNWDDVVEDPGEVREDESEKIARMWHMKFRVKLNEYLRELRSYLPALVEPQCRIESIRRARVIRSSAAVSEDFESYVWREVYTSRNREKTELTAAKCAIEYLKRLGFEIVEGYRSIPRPFDIVVKSDKLYTVEVKGKWIGRKDDPLSFTANEIDWASKFPDRHIICIAYVDGDKCVDVQCMTFLEFQKSWILMTIRGLEYRYNAMRKDVATSS